MPFNGSLGTITNDTLLVANMPTGSVIQVVTTSYTGGRINSANSGAPSSTNGSQIFSQSFTPKSASSRIIVQTSTVSIYESSNDQNWFWLGAWYDTTQIGCCIATLDYNLWQGSRNGGYYSLNHSCASWGTSAKNINVRAGGQSGGNVWVNGSADSYNLSADNARISLIIIEVK